MLLAGLTCAGAGAAPAAAQHIGSPYRFVEPRQDLGPYLAYMFADQGSARLGPKSGPLIGAQYAIRLSQPIQIGANLAYFPAEREVTDISSENPPQVVGTESLNLLLASARVLFTLTGSRTWHHLMPYFIGGVGIALDVTGSISCVGEEGPPDCQLAPDERFDFGTSLLLQFGVGTALIISDRLGARISVEDDIWTLDTPSGYFDPSVEIDRVPPDSDWTNNIQVTVILSYWF
jgi:hypothetical protein